MPSGREIKESKDNRLICFAMRKQTACAFNSTLVLRWYTQQQKCEISLKPCSTHKLVT